MKDIDLTQVRKLAEETFDDYALFAIQRYRFDRRLWDIEQLVSSGKELSLDEWRERDYLLSMVNALDKKKEEIKEQFLKELERILKLKEVL